MKAQKILILLFAAFSLVSAPSFASDKLDVAVPVFDPGIPEDYDEWKKKNIYPEVRRAEARYLAVELQKVLAGSGRWGAVRVMPMHKDILSDIVLYVTIDESTGGSFKAHIQAIDSTGKVLLKKKYKQEVHPRFYSDRRKEGVEPYSQVLSQIASDLYAKTKKLKKSKVKKIKDTTQLRYGMALAPQAFDHTLKIRNGKTTTYKIKHLPAENDPMIQRINMLRVRDDMFTDALQTTYQNFAGNMATDYQGWRKESSADYHAMMEAKRKARGRMWGGILAAAAGVVVAAETKGAYGDAAAIGLIGAGAAGVVSGVQKGKEAKSYKAIMNEHARSFDASLEPQLIEFEEEAATLTGTIDEQFQQFRELLGRVYESENGLASDADASTD